MRESSVSVRAPGAFLWGIFEPFQDDEVKRRLSVRTGSYLPWEPIRRKCALAEETKRIEDYLFDEGYAEATVRIVPDSEGNIVRLRVRVDLGAVYNIGNITITPPPGGEQLAITDQTIKAVFHHSCIVQRCRFTRTQHQEDLQEIRKLFHKRGYPAVRVQSSFDPHTSFDRHTHTVPITITIDQRRAIDVQLRAATNRDALPDDQLREQHDVRSRRQLFDDVEATASAKAIEGFLQTRGYFDARVTGRSASGSAGVRRRSSFTSRPGEPVARGPPGPVLRQARCRSYDDDPSTSTVATKAAGFKGSLFGTNTAATSAELALDVDRLTQAYRRKGYREAVVTRSASPVSAGLGDAALAAALVIADTGREPLRALSRSTRAQPTLLTRIVCRHHGPQARSAALCAQILRELASDRASTSTAVRDAHAGSDRVRRVCGDHRAASLTFREDDVAATRDRLRDLLYRSGRPRASVEYESQTSSGRTGTWLAHYKIRSIDELRIEQDHHPRQLPHQRPR